ncbi:MAG: YCF48-related protein [Bacteroidota bacterium]
MKTLLKFWILTGGLLLLRLNSPAQVSGWTWSNPSPQGNHLSKVIFTDSLTGYAVGGYGTILRTTDAGVNWQQVPGITSMALSSITGLKNGWLFAVGLNGTIIKSVNQGESWQKVPLETGFDTIHLNDVVFYNNDTGYIAGNHHTILRSTNGGSSWQLISHDTTGYGFPFWTISWLSSRVAFATGPEFGLSKTTDGGFTWQYISLGGTKYVYSACFLNPDSGFCAGIKPSGTGYTGFISKTTNGGITWTDAEVPANSNYNHIDFISANTGYVLGDGQLYKTPDAGFSWIKVSDTVLNPVSCLRFGSGSNGIAVGNWGNIFSTTDGGNTWLSHRKGMDTELLGILFPSSDTGYMIGWNQVFRSADRGNTWITVDSSHHPLDIHFFSSQAGMAIMGENSHWYVIMTSNGGATWHEEEIPGQATDLSYPSLQVAYITLISPQYGLYKTTDAGKSWVFIPLSPFMGNKMDFLDNETGIAAGEGMASGVIRKTRDGGLTWETKFTTYADWFLVQQIYFYNETIGYVLARDYDTLLQKYYTRIIKTMDGGERWEEIPRPDEFTGSEMREISFINADTGFVVGYREMPDGRDGLILKTSDGGFSWEDQIKKTSNMLNAVTFIDEFTGFAIGEGGTILTTGSCGDIPSKSSSLPDKTIEQNLVYPNPASDMVHFVLRSAIPGPYLLEFYNFTGRRCGQTFKGTMNNAGDVIRVKLEHFTPGLYFYRIFSGEKVFTGKLIMR